MHESIRIEAVASMNSKAEYNGYKVPRISVEPSIKETREMLIESDKIDKNELEAMTALKKRVEEASRTNVLNCRKRKPKVMSEISPIV